MINLAVDLFGREWDELDRIIFARIDMRQRLELEQNGRDE